VKLARILELEFEEVEEERADILPAVGEGREIDCIAADASEERQVKRAGGDSRLEVLVRGGQETHAHVAMFPAAQCRDLSILEDSENHRLNVEGRRQDFVQKERSTVGLYEVSGTIRGSTGVCALLVAEQSVGGHDWCCQRAHVDCEKRRGRRAGRGDGAGHELLAGARLPPD